MDLWDMCQNPSWRQEKQGNRPFHSPKKNRREHHKDPSITSKPDDIVGTVLDRVILMVATEGRPR